MNQSENNKPETQASNPQETSSASSDTPKTEAPNDISQMLNSLSSSDSGSPSPSTDSSIVPPAPFSTPEQTPTPEQSSTPETPPATPPVTPEPSANTEQASTPAAAPVQKEAATTEQPSTPQAAPTGTAPASTPPAATAQKAPAPDGAKTQKPSEDQIHQVEDELHHRRTGTITGIRDGKIQVRFSGNLKGECPADQFEKLPRVGDRVAFIFEGEINEAQTLVLKRAPEQIPAELIQEGMVVEGFVTSMNTGGLQMRIGGRKAFMPASQIDLVHVEDLTPLINKTIECRIMQVNKNRTRIIVSRRAIMEEQHLEVRKEKLAALKVDQEVEGTVRKIESFGVFIQLDDSLDGLVRLSDLAHHHVNNAKDVVKVGEKVKAKVLRISPNSGKLTLGIKQLTPDPWESVEEKYKVDETIKGKVTNTTRFGAFVELEPGVEGLIPMAEMAWTHVRSAEDVVKKGQEVEVKVIESDSKKRRIGLSIKALSDNPWKAVAEKYPTDSTVDGKVTRLTKFGAFIELEPGVEGMCHVSQIAPRRIKSPEDVLKVGQAVQAKVFEIDTDSQRLSLSIRAVNDPKGAEEARTSGRKSEASRGEIKKHVKSAKQAKAMESLMGKFGDQGNLKGGIG